MNFKTSKVPLLITVLYQIAGLPILFKYGPIFMSHSRAVKEAYPLFLYSAGWMFIIGFAAVRGRREEIDALGLSSMPRTTGRGIHFPREKAWLYEDMPVSLCTPARPGRGHVECLADRVGSIVIFWLPQNLGGGIFMNNLEEEPKSVTVRWKILSLGVTADWKHEVLAVQDPSFGNLRYFGRCDIGTVLHSGELLHRMSEAADSFAKLQGRLIIEDSFIAAYFPRELPRGEELFPVVYGLWREVAAARWPRKKFNPFESRRSSLSLLVAAAVIAAFIVAIAFSLKSY
jgi:hypothetical protein